MNKLFLLPLLAGLPLFSLSQITATFSSTVNTNCNGTDCDYSGPSILINEIMLAPIPAATDGSISGAGNVPIPTPSRGEWIELYNPNTCEPVDISCYFLGNNTGVTLGSGGTGPGGFKIPAGTIIPPAGFCVVRGVNAPAVASNLLVANGGNTVEIIVSPTININGVCSALDRLWFPNAGGWFAFYNENGIPQDAVSWGAANDGLGLPPCNPPLAGCGNSGVTLASYNAIPANLKNYISDQTASNFPGQSLKRTSDGGPWLLNHTGTPSMGNCNTSCATVGASSCTGSATVTASGGTGPYTYLWDDSQAQTGATANGLCDGEYCVTITDALGATLTECVTIQNNVPSVDLNLPAQVCINANAIDLTQVSTPQPGANDSYLYSGDGLNGDNFVPSTANTGSHIVHYEYIDEFGCTGSDSDTIVVNPLPTVTIGNVQSPYCISVTDANLDLQPAGGTLTVNSTAAATFSPSAAGAGTHTLVYSFTDANGCSNSATVQVQVITATPVTMTFPDTVCYNQPIITLSASPSGGTFEINGTAAAQFDATVLGPGNHIIEYSYTSNCPGYKKDSIRVLPAIPLSIGVADNYCEGSGDVTLTPNPAGGSLSGTLVSGNTLGIGTALPGNYSVSYTYMSPFGCTQQVQEDFTISPKADPSFTYGINCAQVQFTNLAPNTPTLSFNWNFGDGQTSTVKDPTMHYTTPGTYTVTLTATDAYNCSYSSTLPVVVTEESIPDNLFIPNIITANNDKINDHFEFPAYFLTCYEYKMYILNRWGVVVFEMNNTNNVFYGKDQHGNDLADGVYFYRIESPDIDCEDPLWKPFCTGNITIAR